MPIDPAALGRLNHPGVVDYFARNPHRLAACRALLDLLSIPLPEWAKRDISGRAAARRNVIAAFKADNPEPRSSTLARRKDNTSAKDRDRIDTSFLTRGKPYSQL